MSRLPLIHRGRRRRASASLGQSGVDADHDDHSFHAISAQSNQRGIKANGHVQSSRRWYLAVVPGNTFRDCSEEMSASRAGGPPPKNALLVALADALAGALGSMLAVVVFYPIDIAKTRAQALYGGGPDGEGGVPGEAARSHGSIVRFRSRTLSALTSLVRKEGPMRLYEGIEAKALQSLTGSFVYFYAYAFIKGSMRRRRGGGPLHPSLNLLAAALAGAVNQAFTLPLENIATRMQTSSAATTGLDVSRSPTTTASSTREACAGSSTLPSGNDHVGDSEVTAGDSGSSCSTRNSECMDGDGDEGGGNDDAARVGSVSDKRELKQSIAKEEKESSGIFASSSEVDTSRGGEDHAISGARKQSVVQCAARESDVGDGGSGRDTRLGAIEPAEPTRSDQQEAGEQQNRRIHKRPRHNGRQSLWTVAGELYLEEGKDLSRFWRGFAPSLILTCNPAINYTAFDLLKALWLRRRSSQAPATAIGVGNAGLQAGIPVLGRSKGGANTGFLNPVEAFFIATAAKSLATLITYPLIRAKVILMMSSSSSAAPSSTASGSSLAVDDDHEVSKLLSDTEVTGREFARAANGRRRRRHGGIRHMCRVMVDIFRHDGIGGLYAGCGAQLLHTILKSALLLSAKEEIERAASSAVFLGGAGVGASLRTPPPIRQLTPTAARVGEGLSGGGREPMPPASLIPPAFP